MSEVAIESFPWFILRPPPEITIDLEEWSTLGYNRAIFLNEFHKSRESQSSNEVLKKIVEKYTSSPTNLVPLSSNDQLSPVYQELLIGHFFLRLAASTTPRLESWLRETEGDLFEYYFRQVENENERLKVLQLLVGQKNCATASLIINTFHISDNDINQYQLKRIQDVGWAIKFTKLPDLVSRKIITGFRRSTENKISQPQKGLRSGVLLKGYIFGLPILFYGSIKKMFERQLATEVQYLKNKIGIDSDIDKIVKNFVSKLSQEIHFTSSLHTGSFSLNRTSDPIFEQLDLYPPCMLYLREKLEETGHIPHLHRVQLGIFFKYMGMDVESQLQYWFNTAIDNVNITYETFNKRAGYQIRHLYGIEGGKKDYAVPSCQTIINDYFCMFQHLHSGILENLLPKMFEFDKNNKSKELQVVLSDTSNYRPKQACSNFYRLLTNQNLNINHPMQWVQSKQEFNKKSMQKNKSKDK